MDVPMKTTSYPNLTSPKAFTTHDVSSIRDVVSPHVIIPGGKKNCPLFSPAELKPGTGRLDKNVIQVHYGVLDIDEVPESALVQALPFEHEFVLFSSYNHLKKGGAWRVIIPFTRPVLPAEWKRVWAFLADRFGGEYHETKNPTGKVDGACKGVSHAYYIPAVEDQENLDAARYDYNEGLPFDVDAALASPRLSTPVRSPGAILVAPTTLEGFRKAVSCQRGPLRKAFAALVKGDAFAPSGARNTTSFQMMRDLAKVLPTTDPDSLRPFLAPSIDDMDPDDGFNLDIVIQQFRTAQADIVSSSDDDASRDIQYAFANTRHHGRAAPYTADELASFAKTLRVPVEDLSRLWVLQKGKTYYILFDGSYLGPFNEAEKHALAYLAPAISADVARFIPTRNGPKAIGWDDMVAHHGTLISQILVDLSRSQSWFDVRNKRLYEAPCPRRNLEPEYSEDVDAWCYAFAGEQYDKFIAWLASVPDVSSPTAILFVKGPSGSGKSMLMGGLGRLWLQDPWDTPPELMDSMNAEFNEGLLKCPLSVADESFPASKSAELRRFMQARSHTLRRKFMANSTIIGAPRIIIAANNKDALKLREVLTADDVRAIAERILYIQPTEEARAIALKYAGRDLEHPWVHNDVLPKHVLWLHQNLGYTKGDRFLVEGTESTFHRSLAVSTSLSSAVCEWVARYLREPKKASQCTTPVIVERDGDVLVSPSALASYWDLYTTNYRPAPELRDVSTALQALTVKGRVVVKVKGKATHYRKIDWSLLQQWADDQDWGDLR